MGRASDEDRAKMNRAARLAIGNSGKRNGNGDLLGTTRGERDRGERTLNEMVENKTITRRQANKAREDALRQAGAGAGRVKGLFGW